MAVDVGNNLPNLKITFGNSSSSFQDNDLSLTKSIEENSALDKNEKSIEVIRKPVAEGFRVYENKGGAFVTGLDLSSESVKKKLTERAARFGLEDHQKKPITQVEIDNLYKSLDIGCEDEKSKNIRLDALHVRGVQEMSTDDVIDYFKEYGPAFVEWINDLSCNVVWLDEAGAARALLGLSKVVVFKKKTFDSEVISDCEEGEIPNDPETSNTDVKNTDDVIFMSDLSSDDDDDVDTSVSFKHESSRNPTTMSEETVNDTPMDVEDSETAQKDVEMVVKETESTAKDSETTQTPLPLDIPVPPGHWRLGVPHQNAKVILLRFASKDDKKLPGAEKRSAYYRKYGNPNYGGMTGIISNTRKRKFNATKHRSAVEQLSSLSNVGDTDAVTEKKGTKRLRMRMHADDEEERVKISIARKNRSIDNKTRRNVHDRLGDFASRPEKKYDEDLCEDDYGEEDDIEDKPMKSTITQLAPTASKTSRFNVWNRLAENMAREAEYEESKREASKYKESRFKDSIHEESEYSSRSSKDLRHKIRSAVSVTMRNSDQNHKDLRSKLRRQPDKERHRSILAKDSPEDSDSSS